MWGNSIRVPPLWGILEWLWDDPASCGVEFHPPVCWRVRRHFGHRGQPWFHGSDPGSCQARMIRVVSGSSEVVIDAGTTVVPSTRTVTQMISPGRMTTRPFFSAWSRPDWHAGLGCGVSRSATVSTIDGWAIDVKWHKRSALTIKLARVRCNVALVKCEGPLNMGSEDQHQRRHRAHHTLLAPVRVAE